MLFVKDQAACRNCPMFQSGLQPFVPDEIVPGSTVFILGQNPGAQEEAQGQPFIGPTGQTMMKNYFPLAGLERGKDVSIGNAIRCRLHGGNDLPPLDKKDHLAEKALSHCRDAHLKIPDSTKLIVAQGEYALRSLTGEKGIMTWRGWLLPQQDAQVDRSIIYTPELVEGLVSQPPVYATMHLATLFHDPALRVTMQADWHKISRILAGTWPLKMPWLEARLPPVWPREFAFDTEYVPDTGKLIRVSLATEDRTVWVVEADTIEYGMVTKSGTRVIMQNAVADLPYLDGLVDLDHVEIEDTMLVHSCLWQGAGENEDTAGGKSRGLPHSLDFLASIYGSINRSKHLAQVSPRLYSGADALITLDVWNGLKGELARDPQSEWIYRNSVLPMAKVIWRAHQRGLRINKPRVKQVKEELSEITQKAEEMAQASVGYPLNLGSSQQVARQLYKIEGIKEPKQKRGKR